MIRRLLLVLLLASPCWATTPVVVQKTSTFSNTTVVNSASLTTHTGNAVAVSCQSSVLSATLTASDGTNTYTGVGTGVTSGTGPGSMRWFVAKNITGVTHALSCTSSGAPSFMWISVYELSGASTTAPVDVPISSAAGGTTGTSAAPSFTLPTTTFANDILLFAATCGNTCSAGAGVDAGNSQTDSSGDEAETFSKTAIGTYSGAFSQTSSTFGVVGVAITDGISATVGPNVGFKGKVGFVGKVGIK